MGYRNATVQTNAALGNISLAAETAIATTGPLNLINDSSVVLIQWYFICTIGTAGVSVTVRVRRGSGLTGGVVNTTPTACTVVAANTYTFSGCYFDTPFSAADLQYTLSAQVGSASANSPVNDVSLIAMVL